MATASTMRPNVGSRSAQRRGVVPALFALVAALIVAAPPAQAVTTDSLPEDFTVLDDIVVFTAADGLHGRELWATDLNATWLLKDVRPGPAGSHPEGLVAIGDRVYFVADDGTHGTEVWATDGTTAGTVLVDDTWPGAGGIAQGRFAPIGNGGDLVFRSGDESVWDELYFYDRSADSATLIEDLNPGTAQSHPSSMTPLADGRVVFSAQGDGVGHEPWITDGSTITSLGDLVPGSGSSYPNKFLELAPGVVLFTAWGPEGNEPWVTDGTLGGTMLLKDINPGAGHSLPSEMVIHDGRAWFGADDDTTGTELWATDGTPGGTTLVHDVDPGAGSSDPEHLFSHGGHLYFRAETPADGAELWRTTGAPGNLTMAVDLRPGPESSWPTPEFSLDGNLILTAIAGTSTGHDGRELFTSDGTTAGTELIHESVPGEKSSFDEGFFGVVHDGTIVFGADGGHGIEVWTSDGTPGGSAPLADIMLGIGPTELTLAGDRVFFNADHPDHGAELWVSGDTPGSAQVIDFVPGPTSSYARVLGVFDDRVVVATGEGNSNVAWITDGTPGGTVQLTAPHAESGITYVSSGMQVGDVFAFRISTEDEGTELWVTDGTPAGTSLLKDINPGMDSSQPQRFTAHRGDIYFQATTATHGSEVWRTDGTAAGTTRLTDINPGPGNASPNHLVSTGDWLWFAANDGTSGTELWRLDDGSQVQNPADINSGVDSSDPYGITAVGERVFFRARGDMGSELYVSDGTGAGTQLVKDIDPVHGSIPGALTASGDRLFFRADAPGSGAELWVSDGTESGTTLVKDLTPGEPSTYIDDIVATSDGVLFTAQSGEGAVRTYRSDGTAAGTVLSGLPGHGIEELVSGSLWYTAFEEDTGRGQLYRAASVDSDDAVALLYHRALDRLSGPDRFATAAAVSADTFESADTVVIARGDVYADALAGGPLAYQLGAPILLTRTGSLPEVTRDEINRLGATSAVILGGTAAVSSAVEDALTDSTSVTTTTRRAGADRFETAALVAADLPATTTAYVVEGANADSGRGWPDAVAVSSLASWTARPILLVTQSRLPDATADALADLGLDDAVVVGGAAAVGADVVAAIEGRGVTVGPRLAGDNRFLTSLAVAEASVDAGMDDSRLWIATGRAFPDALVAGPAAASTGAPLLLVHGTSMTSESDSAAWFDDHTPIDRVVLLGGEAAITATVATVIRSLANLPG